MNQADYLGRRAARAELARQGNPRAQATLLGAWPWTGFDAVAAVSGGLVVPPTEDVRRLVAWLLRPPPEAPQGDRTEAGFDLALLDRVAPPDLVDEGEARAAGLAWLGRLGEEYLRREHAAWSDHRWIADPVRDAEALTTWTSLLSEVVPDQRVVARFRAAWGGAVRASFRGVAGALGLPDAVGREHAARAVATMDALAWGEGAAAPVTDICARVVETAGEPVEQLGIGLGPPGAFALRECAATRDTWRTAAALLGPEAPPSRGAALAVALRLRHALERGTVPVASPDLPGWTVVRANRDRIRGRMRALLREDPAALAQALGGMDALHARTDAAMRRFAWGWAWREARSGFAFDLGCLGPSRCLPPEPGRATPPPALGPEHEGMVSTFLLAVCGRGWWTDLHWWIGGDARGTSKRFQALVAELPDSLADPWQGPHRRSRTYGRLREHLDDGGLDAYLPGLRIACQRVALLRPGRHLKEELREVLAPFWDEATLPLPDGATGRFRDAMAAFLRG